MNRQGDSGPVGLLSATRKTQPVGSAATQDDEVIHGHLVTPVWCSAETTNVCHAIHE